MQVSTRTVGYSQPALFNSIVETIRGPAMTIRIFKSSGATSWSGRGQQSYFRTSYQAFATDTDGNAVALFRAEPGTGWRKFLADASEACARLARFGPLGPAPAPVAVVGACVVVKPHLGDGGRVGRVVATDGDIADVEFPLPPTVLGTPCNEVVSYFATEIQISAFSVSAS
jgi:hypothetical protein